MSKDCCCNCCKVLRIAPILRSVFSLLSLLKFDVIQDVMSFIRVFHLSAGTVAKL